MIIIKDKKMALDIAKLAEKLYLDPNNRLTKEEAIKEAVQQYNSSLLHSK